MGEAVILCGASVRAAAFSALAAGYQPYAIDQYADRDLAAVCRAERIDRYPHGFQRALENAPAAPWIYTGGLENYPRLVDRLAAIRTLWGNHGPALRRVRSRLSLSRVLARHGLAFPAMNPKEFRGGKWLREPRAGSAGLGIRWATEDDLASPDRGHDIQQYLAGQPAGALFAMAGGRAALLGASRQLIGRDWGLSLPFVYLGSIGPLKLLREEREKLERIGSVLAAEFCLAGLVNVDFLRTDGEIWVLEVNPRYSASVEILERSTGMSFFSIHATACQLGLLSAVPRCAAPPYHGKAIVYAHRDCVCSPGFDPLSLFSDDGAKCPQVADLPTEGQKFLAGQPIATVFASGRSFGEVEEQLRIRSLTLQDCLLRSNR